MQRSLDEEGQGHSMKTCGLGRSWTNEEHERFYDGLEKFSHGPWDKITDYVGKKSALQVADTRRVA